MDRSSRLVAALAFLFPAGLSCAGSALAQTNTHSPRPTGATAPTVASPPAAIGSSIIVDVVDEAGMPLDKQAVVKLFDESTQSSVWASTAARSEAQFDDVKSGQYEIEASAPGFKTNREELTATSNHEAYHVLIALRRDDSDAITDIKPGQLLAPKARKAVEKGMEALREGKLNEAQKNLDAAYKLAPANADVNYLLGVLYVRRQDPTQAETYLNRAISLDSRHVGALTELGQLELGRKDLASAVAVLEPAVALDPKRWRGHWLLADAYFRQRQFEKARQQAELAVQGSRGGAIEPRILMGEILARMGRRQEAIQSLTALLRDQPNSQFAPEVRELIASLQKETGRNSAN